MQRNFVIGASAALLVVMFWSGWIIVSRYGVTNHLTVWDVAGLRFGIGGLLALPIVLVRKPWRGLTLKRGLVVGIGSGAPYALLTYLGFYYAPAAHGGVFINGCLPLFTAVTAWFWLRQKLRRGQLVGHAIIIIGVILVGYEGLMSPGDDRVWLGDLIFLAAICLFAMYMVGTRAWMITWEQVLFTATVCGAVVYVPIWLLFLKSTLTVAPAAEVWLQAAYQGLVPSLLGISSLTVAVRNLGATAMSVFLSVVPGVAALAAIPLLGEVPGPPAWIGMAVVTGGILLALGLGRTQPAAPAPAEG